MNPLQKGQRPQRRRRDFNANVRLLLKSLVGIFLLCLASFTSAATETTVSATISPDPPVAGRPLVVTVIVSTSPPGSGTPIGDVTVTYGAATAPVDHCSFSLPATSCSFTPDFLGEGTLFFSYSPPAGNTDFDASANGFSKTSINGSAVTVASSLNPSMSGDAVTFTAMETMAIKSGSPPTGTVNFQDGANLLCSNVSLSSNAASCSTKSLINGTHSITAVYSGDTNNVGAKSQPISQVVQEEVTSVNLDQHGLTGTWYNPITSGQGFVLEVYPDVSGPNDGLIGGGWFTYDVAPAGGVEKERWYTFSGNVSDAESAASLTVFASEGGNFNAGPTVKAIPVGQASITFTDCGHGSFTYSFSDGSGRNGRIPLTRLTPNVTCGTNRDNGAAPGDYLLSGAWYTPSTSGQGLLFDVSPAQNYFTAVWYTYAPNGQSIGGAAGQRWYTMQGPLSAGPTVHNIPILAETGGVFDDTATVAHSQVGTASLVFQSCGSVTLSYSFTSGTNSGKSGSISLQRVGPIPTGCSL